MHTKEQRLAAALKKGDTVRSRKLSTGTPVMYAP